MRRLPSVVKSLDVIIAPDTDCADPCEPLPVCSGPVAYSQVSQEADARALGAVFQTVAACADMEVKIANWIIFFIFLVLRLFSGLDRYKPKEGCRLLKGQNDLVDTLSDEDINPSID